MTALLDESRTARASDVHLQPTPEGLEVHFRVDGVLGQVGLLPVAIAANVVARLKVLADLLTYRTDVPQEGRIKGGPTTRAGEVRVSTFPTLHGERAAIRLFSSPGERLRLADLGLPDDVQQALSAHLGDTSGAILLTGPAGTGKTTTIYACLRDLVATSGGGRSIATLEDPIEAAVAGVSQAQVNLPAGFDLATGLRSLLRQDPEVIAVGEIRDKATAEVAFQASLDRPPRPHHLPCRYRRGSHQPVDRDGDRALPDPERPRRRRLAAPRADALHLCSPQQPRRRRRRPVTPRPRRRPGTSRRRLPGLPRLGLPRPDGPRRVA